MSKVISKTVATDYGVDVTYWRIHSGQTDIASKTVTTICQGYPDKASYTDGHQPLITKIVSNIESDVNVETCITTLANLAITDDFFVGCTVVNDEEIT